MKSLCAILALFSFLLVAQTTESRRIVGEERWKTETSKQPMVDAIEGLLDGPISTSTSKMKTDCHESDQSTVKKLVLEVEEFEPGPNFSSYNDDESKAERSQPKSQQANNKQRFENDFEPRPDLTSYKE